jgi:histidine phosphotransferase ChpT
MPRVSAWRNGSAHRPARLRLLGSRLCHDLIGPVAAINNGVELLGDEDPDFFRDAVALVGDSARKAASRLQFYRFVFGAGQGTPSGQSPQALAAALFDGGAILCDYGAAVGALGLEWQKLACNLLLVAGEALPRGGRLVLHAGPHGPLLEAIGEGNGLPAEIAAALTLDVEPAELGVRTVCAYVAGASAAALGCRLAVENAPGSFTIRSAPASG